jgi:hypothetical protein
MLCDGPKAGGGMQTHFDDEEIDDPDKLVVEEAAGGTTDLESGVMVDQEMIMEVPVTQRDKKKE